MNKKHIAFFLAILINLTSMNAQKLKTEIDKLPKDEVDEDKLKLKTRFRQENTMSKKYEYKSKLFRKIHQLQKRLTRTKNNPGHSQDKVSFRERLIKKYLNRIREK